MASILTTEIPLLRESVLFARRLFSAAEQKGDCGYYLQRRVNWSWRHSHEFYDRESRLFVADPASYAAGRVDAPTALDDVFSRRVGWPNVAVVLLKVAAHWIFFVLGRRGRNARRSTGWKYRKCYVDDIELVFDENESHVVRAVFPFPLNLGRQWRYIKYLKAQGHEYHLDGNVYSPRDLLRFLARRDLRSLARLEARGELRRAIGLAAKMPAEVQLSDEFNIGSLDFTRLLSRAKIHSVNVAHGVGKYFPVHAYTHFKVLTELQEQYYFPVRDCEYSRVELSESFGITSERKDRISGTGLVLLGQVYSESALAIIEAEERLVGVISAVWERGLKVPCYYKPHPNNPGHGIPEGFEALGDIESVNALDNPVLLSFFSTTHIDPRFRGRKFLVRTGLIRPELAFDDDGRIVDLGRLENFLRSEF